MPTIEQHLDDLDRMVDSGKSPKDEMRSQISLIAREVTSLFAGYASLVDAHTKLQNSHSELQALTQKLKSDIIFQKEKIESENLEAAMNRHKVGVTLKNGVTKYYEADSYVLLPSPKDPKTIEFRKTYPEENTYEAVAHAHWSEVVEVHIPKAS